MFRTRAPRHSRSRSAVLALRRRPPQCLKSPALGFSGPLPHNSVTPVSRMSSDLVHGCSSSQALRASVVPVLDRSRPQFLISSATPPHWRPSIAFGALRASPAASLVHGRSILRPHRTSAVSVLRFVLHSAARVSLAPGRVGARLWSIWRSATSMLGRSGLRPLWPSIARLLQHIPCLELSRSSSHSAATTASTAALLLLYRFGPRSTTPARPLRLDRFGPWRLWDSAVEALVLTLAENRRFLFTCMHLLLLLLLLLLLSSLLLLLALQPLSSVSTLLGGITIQSCLFTNTLHHQHTPKHNHKHKTKTKPKEKTCSNCQPHADASPRKGCEMPLAGERSRCRQ